MLWETSGAYCTRLESLCPFIIVTSHCVFIVWKFYSSLVGSVCECFGGGGVISKICSWLHPNTRKRKKRVLRAERRARAKARVKSLFVQ
jgi:hypothetical protein